MQNVVHSTSEFCSVNLGVFYQFREFLGAQNIGIFDPKFDFVTFSKMNQFLKQYSTFTTYLKNGDEGKQVFE